MTLIERLEAGQVKALSIKQPYPHHIFHDGKDVENRDWPTKGRGWFIVHAGVSKSELDMDDPKEASMPRGGIVGMARIVDCVTEMDSPWFYGRYVLPMPARDEQRFTHHSKGPRTPDAALKEWEQACRQRWRALTLVIKAKLEAVESGISIFEDEFMANIVLPSGRTVSEEVRPKIASAYESGAMQPLLPDYSA